MARVDLRCEGTSVGRLVPILTYHSLDETGSVISLAPNVFRRQMRLLADWGFRGIRLSDLLDAWDGHVQLSARSVVLTFDDGFRNILEQAAPVLAELGFGATVFAVSGYCGRKNDWPSQPAGVPRLPLLSYFELRELDAAGIEVGAHGVSHEPLSRVAPEVAAAEVVGSRRDLENGLGRAVTTFAYPYGLENPAIRELVAGQFRGACGVVMGTARPDDDRHLLPRIDAYYLRSPAAFRLFPSRVGGAYLSLRAFGRNCRSAMSRRG